MFARTPVLVIAAVALLSGLSWAGQPSPPPPNVAQVDRTTEWTCPTPTGTHGDWFNVPDLVASLTTTGNPVLVTIVLEFIGEQPASSPQLSPVIDGVRQPQKLDWHTSSGGEVATITFSRLYVLPAGQHTFAAALTCQNLVVVVRGWLTLYELPSMGR
jgi:hypothetical protein